MNKLRHFARSLRSLELLAQLQTKPQRLIVVHHLHVGQNLLIVICHDAHAHCVEKKLVDLLLLVDQLGLVKDGLALLILAIVLASKVLEGLPLLLSESLMLDPELLGHHLAFYLTLGEVLRVNLAFLLKKGHFKLVPPYLVLLRQKW